MLRGVIGDWHLILNSAHAFGSSKVSNESEGSYCISIGRVLFLLKIAPLSCSFTECCQNLESQLSINEDLDLFKPTLHPEWLALKITT